MKCVCEQIHCKRYRKGKDLIHGIEVVTCTRVKDYVVRCHDTDQVILLFEPSMHIYYKDNLAMFKYLCPHYDKIKLVYKLRYDI